MSIALFFAFLMLGWLFFGFQGLFPPANQPFNARFYWGSAFLIWVLLALLGWQVFGPLLHR